MAPLTEWIHLNVSGTLVATTLATLRADPNSVLAKMFGGSLKPSEQDAQNRFLLDRPPSAFMVVLNWLRTGVLDLGSCSRDLVRAEASYWQLEGLMSLVDEPLPDFPDRGSFVRALCSGVRENALVGVKLNGLDLSLLHLEQLCLERAVLSRANLNSCNMQGTIMSKIRAINANFAKVQAAKAMFTLGVLDGSNFEGASLSGAAFSGCQLVGCNFRNADLKVAIFQRSNMIGSDFSGAQLNDAHLQDADLRNCNFLNAQLEHCHLGDADLRGAKIDWVKLGEMPFVRGVKVTEAEYEAIDRPDKHLLKLRIIGNEEAESVGRLRKQIMEVDLIVFVVGYGSITGSGQGEHFSMEAAKLVATIGPDITTRVVDVVGTSELIDDLFFITSTRQWPKVFYKGQFIGGYRALLQWYQQRQNPSI